MKITYLPETKYHIVDGKGSMILSKNEIGLEVDNLNNFCFKNLTIMGQSSRFGKIKQLICAFKFIFNIGG